MGQMITIIRLIDNQYSIKKHTLKRLLCLAVDCNEISIISLVGIQCQRKKLLIKCMNSYLKSNEKNKWPQSDDSFIEINDDYKCEDTITVEMSSKPYILCEGQRRIAIYLMDTNGILGKDMICELSDVLSLFLLTSSTVIYNHKSFKPHREIYQIKKSINKLKTNQNEDELINKILFFYGNFDKNSKLGFGLCSSRSLLENIYNNNEIEKFGKPINCFLMPDPEIDDHTTLLDLRTTNIHFRRYLANLVRYTLFNVDSLQSMKNSNTDKFSNFDDIYTLFVESIDYLNKNLSVTTKQNRHRSPHNKQITENANKEENHSNYQTFENQETNELMTNSKHDSSVAQTNNTYDSNNRIALRNDDSILDLRIKHEYNQILDDKLSIIRHHERISNYDIDCFEERKHARQIELMREQLLIKQLEMSSYKSLISSCVHEFSIFNEKFQDLCLNETYQNTNFKEINNHLVGLKNIMEEAGNSMLPNIHPNSSGSKCDRNFHELNHSVDKPFFNEEACSIDFYDTDLSDAKLLKLDKSFPIGIGIDIKSNNHSLNDKHFNFGENSKSNDSDWDDISFEMTKE